MSGQYPGWQPPDPTGDLEALLSLLTGVAGQVPAGIAGAASLATGKGMDAAANNVRRMTDESTYTPRTQGGKDTLQAIANNPAMQFLQEAQTKMGDVGYDLAGPIGGVFGEMAPDLVDLVIGSHGAGMADNAILAGVKAKGANMKKLEQAKYLEMKGMDRDNIWGRTGWGRGVDGDWRWEIPDWEGSKSIMRYPTEVEHRFTTPDIKMTDFYENPQLIDAYPGFKDTMLEKDVQRAGGGAYKGPYPEYGGVESIIYSPTTDMDELLRTVLHESQHGIQLREDFSRGGSPSEFPKYRDASNDSIDEAISLIRNVGDGSLLNRMSFDTHPVEAVEGILKSYSFTRDGMGEYAIPKDLRHRMILYVDKNKHPLSPIERYNRMAGEVEARAVENRAGRSATERQYRPFWKDFDRAEELQTILRHATTWDMLGKPR